MPKKLLLTLTLFLAVGGSIFYIWKQQAVVAPTTPEPVIQPEPTPSPDEPIDTSDWKTYRNEEYGFELKYPKEWEVKEKAGDNGDLSVVSLVSRETLTLIEKSQVSETCDLSIYYYDSITSEPENRGRAVTIEEMISQNALVREIGSTNLGGINATDVVWGGNGAYYAVLVMHNNHLYKVLSCHKATLGQLSSTEKRIINSFRFLELSQN